MSGHSKWSTIKHKKGKTDAQRGKIFSKLVREIQVAAKEAGPDPDSNPRLRLAIQKGKEANMPNDNIQRAVQKGAGGGAENELEEITFEAYGPAGVGLLVEAVTDNKNRTVPNIKAILNKHGATMATPGAVSYMFSKKAVFVFDESAPEDVVMDIATENGADDIIEQENGSIEVIAPPEQLTALQTGFSGQNIAPVSAEIVSVAQNNIVLDEDQARSLMKLVEKLEDDDDIQQVSGNYDIPDSLVEILAQE